MKWTYVISLWILYILNIIQKNIIHCLKYYISGEEEMISPLQTYSLKHSHPAVNISHTVSCCLWKNYFFFPLVCWPFCCRLIFGKVRPLITHFHFTLQENDLSILYFHIHDDLYWSNNEIQCTLWMMWLHVWLWLLRLWTTVLLFCVLLYFMIFTCGMHFLNRF